MSVHKCSYHISQMWKELKMSNRTTWALKETHLAKLSYGFNLFSLIWLQLYLHVWQFSRLICFPPKSHTKTFDNCKHVENDSEASVGYNSPDTILSFLYKEQTFCLFFGIFLFLVEMEKSAFYPQWWKMVNSELAVFIYHNYPQTSQAFSMSLNTFHVLDIWGCYLDLSVNPHFTTGLHSVAPPQLKSVLSINSFQIHEKTRIQCFC